MDAVQPGNSGSISQLPLLFPFQAGYGVLAGDCPSEANSYNVAQALTVPGGTSGSTPGMPSPVVPLGLLSLQATHASGASIGLPDAGAVVVATANTSGSGCGADAYTLQPTGPEGLSRTEIPYGSYSLTVGGTNVGTVTVNGNSVSFVPTSGPTTNTALPAPVGVSV